MHWELECSLWIRPSKYFGLEPKWRWPFWNSEMTLQTLSCFHPMWWGVVGIVGVDILQTSTCRNRTRNRTRTPPEFFHRACITLPSVKTFIFCSQNPRTPEGFEKGVSEGVSEGFSKGFTRVLEGLTPCKTLAKPFRDPFRHPLLKPF